jgi:TatA/E family protein of Tat protein translocase
MFGSIGMPELLIIFVIALVVFGPRRLPELGRSLGRAITEFRRAAQEFSTTLEQEVGEESRRGVAPSHAAVGEGSGSPRQNIEGSSDSERATAAR